MYITSSQPLSRSNNVRHQKDVCTLRYGLAACFFYPALLTFFSDPVSVKFAHQLLAELLTNYFRSVLPDCARIPSYAGLMENIILSVVKHVSLNAFSGVPALLMIKQPG